MPIKPKSQYERRTQDTRKWSNKQWDRALTPEQQLAKKVRSSVKWRRVRGKKLSLNPLCEDPFKHHVNRGEVVAGAEVHHIVKLVDDISLAYKIKNLMSVCKACHACLD